MACWVCKYFTLRTIHTLYEKIAFSLSEIAFSRKIRRIRTVHSAKGEVTVKLTIIYGVVRVRNLWPTSVLHAAVGWLWVVKRRDYPPIRLMGRGEVGEEKREGGRIKLRIANRGRQIKDSSRPRLRTCTWLRTWQCYYRLLVVILVKYCSSALGRELSKRTSNLPSNNTGTSTTAAFLDIAQPPLPSPHAVA